MTNEQLEKLRVLAERAANVPWWIDELTEELGKPDSPVRAFIEAAYPVLMQEMIFEIATLRRQVENLEKEADWLARSAANGGWSATRFGPQQWREMARKAVGEAERGQN